MCIRDRQTGEAVPTRERIGILLSELDACASELGCADQLGAARKLLARNGSERQREVAAADDGGTLAVARWLASEFVR